MLYLHNLHYEKFSDGALKCIEDSIPFKIPNSWSWERLGNISSIARGGSPRPINDYLTNSPEGVNWIKIGDTEKDGKYIYKTKEKIKKEGISKSRLVHKGDFLLTNSMSFGRPYILKTDGCIHDGWLVIGNIDGIFDQDYLYYALSSNFMYAELSKVASGSTVQNLKSDTVKNVLFPIPPIHEQKIIASKISSLLNFIDRINEGKEDLITIIQKTKSKILDLAIRGKLVLQDSNDEPASVLLERIRQEKEELIKSGKLKRDKRESVIFRGEDNSYYETIGSKTVNIKDELPYNIPSTWTWVRLGTIGNWGAGATPNRAHSEYYGGGIPWLKTGDLNDDYITEIPETITELALKETSVKLNPVGSILIAMYGATIGKLGILTKPATTNQACCACCPVEGVYNKYLFYFLMSHKSKFINCGIGGAQPNISKEKIVATLMPLPPINEQKAIVARIEKLGFLLNSINADIA